MKLNIEVVIDWIGEDGSIDDIVKQAITDKVVETVTGKIEKKMEESAAEAISGKVDDMCTHLVDDFLKRKVTITDKWGKEIISDTTIEDILKRRFDEFWNATVDKDGRGDSSSYGGTLPRFEWAIDKNIKAHAETFAKTLTTDTANKIKANMTEQLRNAIGAKLIGELGFDKLFLPQKA